MEEKSGDEEKDGSGATNVVSGVQEWRGLIDQVILAGTHDGPRKHGLEWVKLGASRIQGGWLQLAPICVGFGEGIAHLLHTHVPYLVIGAGHRSPIA